MIAPHQGHQRRTSSGITLLEMLVALALMSLLAVLGLSTLTMAGRTLTRSQVVSGDVGIMLARDELRLWIEHSVAGAAVGDHPSALRGTSDSLAVQSIRDDGTFWPGAPVELTLSSVADEDALGAFQLSGLRDSDQTPFVQDRVISGPSGRISFRYFGQIDANFPPDWTDNWPAEAGLPLLVAISVTDARGDYPPLIVRPGKIYAQREMSLSSLLPPALPSRP
jgi:prepilin-type N-terminal cleavage/methylation domain-containing protein